MTLPDPKAEDREGKIYWSELVDRIISGVIYRLYYIREDGEKNQYGLKSKVHRF